MVPKGNPKNNPLRRYRQPDITFRLPDTPPTTTLQPGSYHRVLSDANHRSYPADSFNPYIGYTIEPDGTLRDPQDKVCAGTRFAPVLDGKGKIISTLYLASTDRAAYAEMLVRAKSQRQITYKAVSSLERVTLELTTKLKLLNLVPPFINNSTDNAFKVSDKKLVHSAERYYKQTCRFASEVHAKYPDLHGIHWHSRQESNNSVVVLFGDRTPKGCLTLKDNFAASSVEEMQIWAPDAARYKAKIDHDLLKYLRVALPDIDHYPNW